jgi:hypothetical protein
VPHLNSSLLRIEQIPQLDGETGARAHSAWIGYTLYFANIPEITFKNLELVYFLSDRVNKLMVDGLLINTKITASRQTRKNDNEAQLQIRRVYPATGAS